MTTVVAVPQHDLYATVTGRIVAALERGAAPWVRPWSQDVDSMPVNAASRRPYRGINALLLALEATSHGYPLNRWLTYRQATELGGQVRRGERGTTVVLWRLRKVAATAETYPEPQDPDLHERVIPLLRAFTVFNLAQVDGVPAATASGGAARLGARGPRRGTARCLRRHPPPRWLAGVLPPGRRRDPPAASERLPGSGVLLRHRAARAHALDRHTRPGATVSWDSASAMTPTRRRS